MRTVHVIAALSGLLAGCSVGQDLRGVDAATASFHQRMNAGQYDAIYDASSPQLKAQSSRASLTQLLQGLHDRLGAFQSARRQSFQDNLTPAGHQITVSYASTYSHAAATETFVYRITPAGLVIAAYNVSSTAILTPAMQGGGATLSPQDASATAVAVADLHRLYNAGQYADIYTAAAPQFRGVSTLADTTAMFEGFHNKLGLVRGMRLIQGAPSIPVLSVSRAVIVRYATTFERGAGTETVTYAMDPAGPRLLGYDLKANTAAQPGGVSIAPPPPAS